MTTVTVRARRFASEFTTTDPAVTRLIRSTVPATCREWLAESRTWLVFATRVPKLLAALQTAGIEVVNDRDAGVQR